MFDDRKTYVYSAFVKRENLIFYFIKSLQICIYYKVTYMRIYYD